MRRFSALLRPFCYRESNRIRVQNFTIAWVRELRGFPPERELVPIEWAEAGFGFAAGRIEADNWRDNNEAAFAGTSTSIDSVDGGHFDRSIIGGAACNAGACSNQLADTHHARKHHCGGSIGHIDLWCQRDRGLRGNGAPTRPNRVRGHPLSNRLADRARAHPGPSTQLPQAKAPV